MTPPDKLEMQEASDGSATITLPPSEVPEAQEAQEVETEAADAAEYEEPAESAPAKTDVDR